MTLLPPAVLTALNELRARPIPVTEKGFTSLSEPVSTAELAARRPGLAEFSYPLMTLREAALAHNIAGMAEYCARSGVLLAPTGKTPTAPPFAAHQPAA